MLMKGVFLFFKASLPKKKKVNLSFCTFYSCICNGEGDVYFILSLKRALALHRLQPGSQSSAWLLSARISDKAFGCGFSSC